jgi:hypothetical protein
MMEQNKYLIYFLGACFIAGFLVGYLIYPKFNQTEKTISAATEISVSSAVQEIANPPINFSLPAKKDTLWKTRTVVDTVYKFQDIVASADTVLPDSSKIGVEYSYKQERFKFKLALRERVITNTIKETITVTNTVEKSGGIIFLSVGYGIVGNNDKFSTGFYIGVGYSFKLF